MENNEQLKKSDWLPFDETEIIKEEKKEVIDSKFEDIFEDKKSKDIINDKFEEELNDSKEVKDSLKKQYDTLNKQHQDTKIWGNKQRAAYVTAKKKIDEKIQKMFDEGTLFEEDVNEIKDAFNHSFETEDLKDIEAKEDPYKPVVDKLVSTLEEYKNWNAEDTNADTKFQAFFKHLELVTPKKLEDIRKYLSTEEPKKALKYILDEGDKYYNKFYKQVLEKGDAFSYIEELTNKNEKLEKKIKKLEEELDQTEGKVYGKPITSRGGIEAKKPFVSKWGEAGNFFDN